MVLFAICFFNSLNFLLSPLFKNTGSIKICPHSGFIFSICASIFSSDVSHKNRQFSFFVSNLVARSFICSRLSSPEIYNTNFSSKAKATCNARVDFPIPGSPPNKIIDPGTIPPPRTLSNSVFDEENRFILPVGISLRVSGCCNKLAPVENILPFFSVISTSST